jgi:hypothetical protein
MDFDLSQITPGKLRNAARGTFFVALEERSAYLAGAIGNVEGLVMIAGDEPFRAAGRQMWGEQGGIGIGGLRFKVDVTSGKRRFSEQQMERGELFHNPLGFGLCVFDGRQHYLFDLEGGPDPKGQPQTEIGYSRWRIVAGSEEHERELFRCEDGKGQLIGFDPTPPPQA